VFKYSKNLFSNSFNFFSTIFLSKYFEKKLYNLFKSLLNNSVKSNTEISKFWDTIDALREVASCATGLAIFF